MPASPYTDLDRPPLRVTGLRRALVVPGGLWRRLEVRAETGSTNADVVAAARAGEPEGLVVVAESQTAGRGRRDRVWVSPPRAGLTLSVLLRPGPQVPPRAYGWLPLLAGVALVRAVRARAEVDAGLKWPNDLLAGPAAAKCAGILAEGAGNGAVALGIGLNVTTTAAELPADRPATSLRLAGAKTTDRDTLLRALLRELAELYAPWRDAGGDAQASGLREAYREMCRTLGEPVRVLLPGGEELTGGAVSVDGDGQLVVNTPDGPRTVTAGDVVHVR
ncbi:biotin--[acetyl-CoA-carboxylase] ligase [Spirilliplanes yamanashiensis]|uniref:biotin--[biotin carboxyl-carrier protein] ligase n=1 Tax=Spirilliplanes yamanashiensis TaxID=42233 RepID=A0A8J3Y3A3_9ACTN|nr:biotin--[acetyl-CoA-carboxylase] ligase [Spirilliplanes yamanashiensis]MDP9814133.1 BirA family biotin operon repressor/biotin-[acetyl-CoA-carboxylase] ligase [Spirilliplanes yamanashiensis]GIJ00886.1 biotin--[acetyl-CoA-carboxylase] ligase [Spirilliplanes yamanashiensis]